MPEGRADEEQVKRWMPKYFYWAKSPPKPRSYRIAIVNPQQRKFQLAMTAFNLAKIAAIVTMVVLVIGRI